MNRVAAVAIVGAVCMLMASGRDAEAFKPPGSERGWWVGGGIYVPLANDSSIAPDFKADAEIREKFARKSKSAGDEWKVEWNAYTGYPQAITGTSGRRYKGDPGQAALEFIVDYESVLFPHRPELAVLEYDVDRSIFHEITETHIVTLIPAIQGVPVWGCAIGVRIDRESRILGFSTSVPVIPAFALPAAVPVDVAFSPLIQKAVPDIAVVEGEPALVVYTASPPRLAYRAIVSIGIPEYGGDETHGLPCDVLVDAATGELLYLNFESTYENPLFPIQHQQDAEEANQRQNPDTLLRRGQRRTVPIIHLEPREIDSLSIPANRPD